MRLAMNLRRFSSSLLALSVLVPLPALGEGVEQLEVVESPRPARPLFIVPPDFPPDVAELKEPVVIEMVGTILQNGQLNVRSVTGDPKFAQAVTEVMKWWRFGPAVEECRAVEGEILAQVSFSGSTADPHIFVSTPKQQPSTHNKEVLSSFQWSKRPSPDWPSRGPREGDVRLLYWLMPDGTVKDVSMYSSFPARIFDEEAIAAVKQWKAKWLREPPPAPICMEQQILFCQSDSGRKASVVGCQ